MEVIHASAGTAAEGICFRNAENRFRFLKLMEVGTSISRHVNGVRLGKGGNIFVAAQDSSRRGETLFVTDHLVLREFLFNRPMRSKLEILHLPGVLNRSHAQ